MQKQDNEFQKRFKAMNDKELIDTFNEDVGKPGWVAARSRFHFAVHEEFKNRGFDYSDIFNKNSFSWKNKIQLIGKKIIKQNINKKTTEYPGVLWFQGMESVLKIWKKNPNLTKRQIGIWYSWKADTKENNQPLSESEIKGIRQTFKRWKRRDK